MKKLFLLAAASLLTFTAAVQAAESEPVPAGTEGITMTVDPALGSELTEFPAEFSITFYGEGLTEVKKSALGGNPINVTDPEGKTVACQVKFDGSTTAVFTPAPSLDRTIKGEYKLKFVASKMRFVVNGSNVNNGAYEFPLGYTVVEAGGDTPEPIASGTEGITMTADPAFGSELDEFPAEFTITFYGEGLTEVKKSALGGNPVTVTDPDGISIACQPVYNGTTSVVFKPAAALDRNVKGEYKLKFTSNKMRFVVNGTNVSNLAYEFPVGYTVVKGSGDDPVDDSVKYDVTLTGTTPKLAPEFDVSMRTFEIVQFIFNLPNLMPNEGAVAKIEGPNYNFTAPLFFNWNATDRSCMKASFVKDPEYNGDYTLTIAKGSVGDELFLSDPEKGHSNDTIKLEFKVVGGKEYIPGGVETTLAPESVNPAVGTTVENLDDITLKFDEKVYFDAETEFKVGYMTDLQATGYSNFGTARLERVSDTELRVLITPVPTVNAMYRVVLTEGAIWNEEHEANAEAGIINTELPYSWYLYKDNSSQTVDVVSHEPKSESYVARFEKGEGVTFVTSDDSAVASLAISIDGCQLDSEMAQPFTVLAETRSTTKNAEGNICWLNESETMRFDPGYYFTVNYTLYNADDQELTSGSFDFYGNANTGIDSVDGDGIAPEVFDLMGISASKDLENLPAGIYIVNGKKIVKK